MPGFICYVQQNSDSPIPELKMNNICSMQTKSMSFANATVKYYSNGKFENDKVFAENDEYFVCIEGVLLNSRSLINKFAARDNFDLICKMFKQNPQGFPLSIKGDFSGIIYDKKADAWHVFTNYLATKPVYYYHNAEKEIFVASSNLNSIVQVMQDLGITTSLDMDAAYYMLSFGFMLENTTLEQKIKKLRSAMIATLQNNRLKLHKYYEFPQETECTDSVDKIIDNLDALLSESIHLEYGKDEEYVYKHVAALSGGRDARMNAFYAHKLAYKNVQNITYSQNGYIDETSSQQMAAALHNDYIFYSLDNGNFLQDTLEDIVIANDGLILYCAISPQLAMQRSFSWRERGIFHTGQLAGVPMGAYVAEKDAHTRGCYSTTLLPRIRSKVEDIYDSYPSHQFYMLSNRGLNGILNAYLLIQQETEHAAAQLDYDFFDYAMKIPFEFKKKSKLYIQWYKKKLPHATKYICTNTRTKIGASKAHVLYKLAELKIIRKLKLRPDYGMNPFDYWYSTNPNLPLYFETYYRENIDYLTPWPNLMQDCKDLFWHGNLNEKAQVMTLIEAIKYHKLS